MNDFEDAAQAAAAATAGVEAIITRNGVDFSGAPIPVYSPDEFLAQLSTTD